MMEKEIQAGRVEVKIFLLCFIILLKAISCMHFNLANLKEKVHRMSLKGYDFYYFLFHPFLTNIILQFEENTSEFYFP